MGDSHFPPNIFDEFEEIQPLSENEVERPGQKRRGLGSCVCRATSDKRTDFHSQHENIEFSISPRIVAKYLDSETMHLLTLVVATYAVISDCTVCSHVTKLTTDTGAGFGVNGALCLCGFCKQNCSFLFVSVGFVNETVC